MKLSQDSSRLANCIRDLMSLSSLPTIWESQPLSAICKSLADILMNLLPLRFIYVRVDVSHTPCEHFKFQRILESETQSQAVDRIRSYVGEREEVLTIKDPVDGGEVNLAIFPIGIHADLGIIAAGGATPEFPDEVHSLLLSFIRNQAAFYLQRVRFVEQERAYGEKLQALSEAGHALHSLDLNEALQVITDKARQVIGAHQSVTNVKMQDDQGQSLTAVSVSQHYVDSVSPENSIINSASSSVRDEIQAPLVRKDGQSIGSIQLSNKYEGEFSEGDHEILRQLSRMASVSIENAYLFESLQERARLAALTADIGMLMTTSETLSRNLQNCANSITDHLSAASVRIWTLDRSTQTLILQANAGLFINPDPELRKIPLGKFKIGLVAEERKAYWTNSLVEDPLFHDEEWIPLEGIVAFAGIPMIVDNDLVGVLAIFSKTLVTEITLKGLEAVAGAIAVGIKRKYAELALVEETESLDTLNKLGQTISAELELEKLMQAITDAATQLSGAKFGAFFHNAVDEKGEFFTLYTISGVSRKLFENYFLPRNTGLFGPTFRGEAIIRLDNVLKDSRYGKNQPYYGTPPDHLPVVSYMAVPVSTRSGEVVGGLFFGHPEPGIFTERAERMVVGLAAQAAVAIDNAKLFEELRREQAKTETGLREKEVLLEELHHRVKNNLQFIISLINLQSKTEGDASHPRILDDIKNRVKTIALLHEKFYNNENVQMVDLGKYLESLANELYRTYTISPNDLSMQVECKPCAVQISKAMPLGLIVNELISNSLKHAFPTRDRGEIRIELEQEEPSVYRLLVADNGVGLPQALDFTTCKSLGLRLVRILVNQVEGSLEIKRNPGTSFQIRFSN